METNAKKIEGNGSKAPTLRGNITSVSSEKTITVSVETMKTHPKYGKKYLATKKYLVHVPEAGSHKVGDTVSFRECRPISRRKRHEIVQEA